MSPGPSSRVTTRISGLPLRLRRPGVATHALILSFAALKLAIIPWFELAPYEAHYALYGYYLDWSYVDHPPLVGWLQGLMLQFASSDPALRLIPIALTSAALYLLAAITGRLYPRESPWLPCIAVLMLQGALILHLAVGMAPEVPLAPLSLLTLWFVHAVLADNRRRDWLALGIVLGLAGLTKYTALMLAFSVLLALLVARRSRLLLQPGPWLAALVALLLISPVLIWNWQHDWLSLAHHSAYQLDRGAEGPGQLFGYAVRAQLEQIAAYSPLVYFGGILAIVWALRGTVDLSTRLLLVFALPNLLFFCWASTLGGSARPHWTFVGWLFVLPLLGRWLIVNWSRSTIRGLTYVSASYSLVLVLALHLILLPVWPFADFQHPARSLIGWKHAALHAESLRRTMAEKSPAGEPPVLLVKNWHDGDRLAWYARPTPVIDIRGRPSQFAFWFGGPRPGIRGILVIPDEEDRASPRPVPGLACTLLERRAAYYGSSLANRFFFYRCES